LQHRANALRVIGRFMFRMSHARPLTDVALAGLVLAGAGSAWLFASVIAEGRELTAAEGFVLHLLVAAGVFFGLGWLVLRQHWRGRLQQQQEIDEAKRKLDTAVGHMSQGLVMFDAHQRIALCNRRYMELYGVSPAVVKPACRFANF
jgi:PAS domain-containing protein